MLWCSASIRQNASGKFKVEAHTVLSAGAMLSSSWPAASEGWRSHKYFQQRYGQQSTPSDLWPVIWLGVEAINTPCWQAGVFQLFDCWSDRWSAWVCKEMMLLLLINTYSNSCWGTCSPEQGGSSTDSHLYLTSGALQKDLTFGGAHQHAADRRIT